MSAKKRRENTFRIDYANVPKKPSSEEVHQFVGVTLGLKREELMRIQYSRNLGVAFVKAASLEIAQKVVEENDNTHELTVDGKIYKIRLVMEDGAVEVKLFNLSEDVTNDKIARFLIAYGEMLSIREELWDEKHHFAGLPTGVRVARMIVKKNIPSYVSIDCETTQVAYYGQQQSCRHCSESVHNGISCVQNKKLLLQKLAACNTSYADVAKNTQSTRSKIAAPKQATPRQIAPKLPNSTAHPNPTTNTAPSTSGLMPPPAIPVRSVTDVEDPMTLSVARENENEPWTRVTRRSAKKNDGNETDSSTSSKGTHKRPLGKKMRCDEFSDPHDADMQL